MTCNAVLLCKNTFSTEKRKKVSILPRKPAPEPKANESTFAFDFRAAARKAVYDHPEIKKNTIFVDAANDDYIAAPRVMQKLDDDDDAYDELKKTVRTAKRLKTSFSDTIFLDQKHYIKSVVFHRDRHTLYDPENRAIDDVGTFDHETGHVLSPETQGTLAENTADAYAAIRHVQRFDGQKTDLEYAAWKRSVIFITSGQTSHLTTFTLDKITIDRATAHFVSLTPAETAAIAKAYAQTHTPDENRLKTLARDFRAARDKKVTEATFLRIAAITLRADPSSDTFYMGARALMTPLNRANVKLDGKTIRLKDPKWDAIRDKLDKKTASLPAAHPLRNLKF